MVALGRRNPVAALEHFDRAVALDPDRPANHLNRAQALVDLGRLSEATATLEQIAAAAATDPRFFMLQAEIARQSGQTARARTILTAIVNQAPTLSEPRRALARLLLEIGEPATAVPVVRQLTRDADAQNLAGTALQALGRHKEAVACYAAAVAADPSFADAHANLGTVLNTTGRTKEGLEHLQEAHRLQPERAEIEANMAILLNRLDRSAEGARRLQSAIDRVEATGAVHPALYTNLANALALIGRIEDACDAHRRAADLDPSQPLFLCNLMFDLHFDPRIDGTGLMRALADWGRRFGHPPDGPLPPPDPDLDPDRRLRVGYVCADFRDHSNANVFGPLIEGHDPEALDVICYAGGQQRDAATERMRQKVSGWVETDGLSHRALAERVRADRIDILVDLSGHTHGTRLEAFGYRPAPVQLAWVNATGHPAIDWVLTDGWMWPGAGPERPVGPGDPSEAAAEPPWRLPIGALPFRLPVGPAPFFHPEAPEIGPGPAARGEPPTFGCYNNLMKLNDRVIETWAACVRAVPGARLLLKVPALEEAEVADEIRVRFAAAGLPPEHLLLQGRTGRREHMAAYDRIDVALDPFPGNGGATTWEALWMGVPVVTLNGDRPNGRAGASILGSIGLDSLVAGDPDTYVSLAAALVQDRDRLAALRRDLRGTIERSAGFGPGQYAAAATETYRQMWQYWLANGNRTAR